MTQAMWLGIFRHVLTALGGGLMVAKGYADESTVNAGIGAAVTLAGVAWSVIDKRAR
jgi:hypothetical protein